ncbi:MULTISPECIES: DUF3846 domain-containing protein [Pseudofrankia]|uniref:DUF3846 domain-containing protein n=1 Tax=Pseudofrankia TaxID=2994363 RepID=UPI000234BE92|nr:MULTISPECIES: DUF3846 domain-containing protein [Pseudofrankia]OHV40375.1 hypothetical protein BCD49_39700 [Pseudofrankia sp. EUN1h]
MIEVVVIPADPATPARVESLDADSPVGFQRLVGGNFELVYVDDEVFLFVNDEGLINGLPMNPRVLLLAASLDPDFTEAVLCGDAVVVGPASRTGSTTSAPVWLRDLCAGPARFQIEQQVKRTGAWIPMSLVIGEPFFGLALVARMARRAPNRTVRLTRLGQESPPRNS